VLILNVPARVQPSRQYRAFLIHEHSDISNPGVVVSAISGVIRLFHTPCMAERRTSCEPRCHE